MKQAHPMVRAHFSHIRSISLFCILLLAAFPNCSGKSPDRNSLPDDSLYQLKSTWVDQNGKQVTLADFSGKIQIVGLIFTHCAAICPAIVSDMQSIERNTPWYRKHQLHFMLVTLDPARDTPDVLKTYMQKRGLDPEQWTSIVGTPADTNDLAALLGVKVQPQPDGSFAHSRAITVLSPTGQMVFQDSSLIDGGQNFIRAAVKSL